MKSRKTSLFLVVVMIATVFAVAVPGNVSADYSETIYIKPDGTISPSSAHISKNGDVYTLTDNVSDPIIVQRSGIILDGAGKTVNGSGSTNYGIDLAGTANITIKNFNIIEFSYGIRIYFSGKNISLIDNSIMCKSTGIFISYSDGFHTVYNNTILSRTAINAHTTPHLNVSENTFTATGGRINSVIIMYGCDNTTVSGNNVSNGNYGIRMNFCQESIVSNNTVNNSYSVDILISHSDECIIENNTVSESYQGIWLSYSNYCTVSGNIMYDNVVGIVPEYSCYNIIKENYIATNKRGFRIFTGSNYNTIYHNHIIDNDIQLWDYGMTNTWHNDDYEGNYWSDYTGLDDGSGGRTANDGIGDTLLPHLGVDWYPLIPPGSANEPPSADAGSPYIADEGSVVTFDASGSSDPDDDELQFRWDLDNDGSWDSVWSTEPTITKTWDDDHTGTVVVEVSDGEETDTDTANVTVNNLAPYVDTVTSSAPVYEGSAVTVSVQASDAGSDTICYSFDWDNNGIFEVLEQSSPDAAHAWYDNDEYQVNVRVTDDDGGYADAYTIIGVLNVDPVASIDDIVQPYDGFILSSDNLDFVGSFTDAGTEDIHTLEWNFGDDTVVTGTLTPTHAYAAAGTYTVTFTVTDDDGGVGMATTTVIVLAEEEAAQLIISDIEDLNLPDGPETSLITKLENALKSILNDRPSAEGQLGAFINEVEAQRGKGLTEAQADYLIPAAQSIMDNL